MRSIPPWTSTAAPAYLLLLFCGQTLCLRLHKPALFAASQDKTETIKVQYDASVSDIDREKFEDAIGLTSSKKSLYARRTSQDPRAAFEYKIRGGTYAFWATIIGETKVAKVVLAEQSTLRLPSVSFDIGAADVMRLPRVVQRRGQVNCILVDPLRSPERATDPNFLPCSFKVEGLVDELSVHPAPDALMLNYLTRRFEGKGGHLDDLGGSLDYIEVKADHLSSEIITSHHFWEKLYIYVVFFPVGQGLRFHFIFDGEYAPSGGSVEPSDDAFRSMEKEYASDFTDYVKRLATDLQDCLRRKPGYE